MNIGWTRMKGVCLLLLAGTMYSWSATAGVSRGFAADINTVSFARLLESSTSATPGVAETTPFKEEPIGPVPKVAAFDPSVSSSMPAAAAADPCDNFCGAPGQVWFHGDYVHWWTSGAHLPSMVQTLTGSASNIPATVFGDETVYGGNHDGYRANFGAWLGRDHLWGVEADYLDVAGRPNNYDSGFTDGYSGGNPFPIVRVLVNPATFAASGPEIDYTGFGGFYVGRITVQTNDYFQEAGITLRRQLRASEWSTCNQEVNWTDSTARTFRLDGIFGYRFARLIDTVNEQDDNFQYNAGQPNYLYDYQYVNDFKTVNDFNGGELGLNMIYTMGRWSLDVTTKAALGVNNEYVRLYNQQTIDVSNAPGGPFGPAGITAINSTPLQEFSRNVFSAIPELTVTGGYQVTDHMKVTVGYDLLYWTAAVRAADQIAVNSATGFPYGTALPNNWVQPFSWNESHYFAQGLRVGGELRF
jgi:hypothetical protein